MAFSFVDALQNMDNYGLMDIWLPFFLIFIAAYAVLDRINIFAKKGDEGNKNKAKAYNVVLALILSILPVIFHITGEYKGFDLVRVINESLWVVGLIVVAFLMISLVTGPFGSKFNFKNNIIGSWVLGGAILFIINFAFPDVEGWVGLLTIFIIVVAVMTSKNRTENQTNFGISLMVFGVLSLVIYIFGSNMGYFGELPYYMQDSGLQAMIIFVAVIAVLIGFITKGDNKPSGENVSGGAGKKEE